MSTGHTPLFTEKQRQIIDSFGRGQAVVAGAGCGKTTTLVAKCLALIQQNPNAKFCAVSFTEKSVRDLKESLAKGFLKAGLAPERSSHWVKTIHGLCSTIIQEFPVPAGLQGGEKILLEDESSRLWLRSLNLLWSQNDNAEISEAVDRLLQVYSKQKLEELLVKLRSLMSFGVETFIRASFHRNEVKDLWLVFESVYQRFQHYKSREGALDFNDLEIFALKALQDKSVQKYYQDRFDLVMVDEFQDTNPLQGQILEKFVRPGYRNLCIVGDPKQSIYRFRDADVSVFQDLTQRLELKHLLDTNYRSRPEIIQFVNDVCAPVFEASHLGYEALIAGREDLESNEGARVSRLMLDDEMSLAKFLKDQESRGIDLSEYVILARSLRKEKTQKFLNALNAAAVPFLLGSGGRFYSDPRVQELVAFLKGWVSPKNVLSQVAALRAPWIDVSDERLMDWKDQYFTKFFEEYDHPIAHALKKEYLKSTALRPGQILEAIWNVADPELHTPLVALWHKAEQLSSQNQRFEEVVQYFSKAIENDKIEKEIPPPAQKGVVRLLTVHGSKGLQFPRVILLDFDGTYSSSAGRQDLIWERTKGVHLFHRNESGRKDSDDVENIKWTEIEKAAAVAESKRVFYVALTRAQEELILAWKKEVKISAASRKPGYEPLLTDSWRAWVEATTMPAEKEILPVELAPVLKDSAAIESQVQGDLFSSPAVSAVETPVQNSSASRLQVKIDQGLYRPRHSPSEWMVLNQCGLRYQKLYLQSLMDENEVEDVARAESGVESQHTIKGGRKGETVAEKGQRVHALIEHEQWVELEREFSRDSGSKIVSELRKIVENTPKMGSSNPFKVYKEQGFEVPLEGPEALVGMIDRLEIDAARKLVRVVDYKFTAKPKDSSALLAHYLLQLQLYVWAATKLVSFKPETVEACLIHFTPETLEVVNAPSEALKTPEIEAQIKFFFERAKSTLTTVLKGSENAPKPGDYCRYCEFKASCPAFQI